MSRLVLYVQLKFFLLTDLTLFLSIKITLQVQGCRNFSLRLYIDCTSNYAQLIKYRLYCIHVDGIL